MVWKVILPPITKDHFLGKWSPNWEGPYLVSEVFEGNAYRLMHVNSDEHIRAINGKYLKLYKPSMNEIELKHKSLVYMKISLMNNLKSWLSSKLHEYSWIN